MSTIAFRNLEDVIEKALKYPNQEEVQMYFPKEDTYKGEYIIFDPVFDDNTYNIINDVVAFVYQYNYYVIPFFFGIDIILDGRKLRKDRGLRVLYSTNFAVPLRNPEKWLELMRDMYETNHTWSRESRYMPENVSTINREFFDRSYVYSTRCTGYIGRYNYDNKMIVFYYYDGKIYVTADFAIVQELEQSGFIRDETLEIPVLNK